MKNEARVGVHACSVCEAQVPRSRLMCHRHWRLVPPEMQTQVWRTWSRFCNRKEPRHAMQLLADYRRAADAATNYVTSITPTENRP